MSKNPDEAWLSSAEAPLTIDLPPTKREVQVREEAQPAEAPPAKLTFQRGHTQRSITVSITWPELYPNYEPWTFKLKVSLSQAMQEKREKWLGLPAGERNKKAIFREEIISEVCDLLVDYPTGFGDLGLTQGLNPGSVLRNYLETTSDPDQYETIYAIMEAVDTAYWGKCLPREFRPQVQNLRT
jgi:hypothetical protein